MNKKNLVVVIVIITILVLISVILLVVNMNKNSEEENGSGNSSSETNVEYNNTELAEVTSINTFISVKNIVNDYLEKLTWADADILYNVINSSYLTNNGITKANILNYFNTDYYSPGYVAKKMYYRSYEGIEYYFVNGYIIDFNESVDYYGNISVLVLIKDNIYNIIPIAEGTNFDSYINNYNYQSNVEVTGDNTYITYNIDDESKLIVYLQDFINLLYANASEAYDLLDVDTKNYFGSLSNFISYSDSILEKLSPKIFSYSTVENDGYTTYNIIDDNQNVITVTEYSLMNYTINLKKSNFDV